MAIKLAAMRCRCQGSKAQICKINYKLRSEFVSWPVASIGKYIRVQEIFVQVAEFASSLIGWRNQLAQNMAINMHETANKNQIINNQSFVLLPADFPRPKKRVDCKHFKLKFHLVQLGIDGICNLHCLHNSQRFVCFTNLQICIKSI